MVPGNRLDVCSWQSWPSATCPCEPGEPWWGCRGAHCTQKALQHPPWCVGDVLPCQDAPEHLVFDWYRCIFVLCSTGHLRPLLPWVELNYWIVVFLLFESFLCAPHGVVHVPELQGLWAWVWNPSTWGAAANFSEVSGHGTNSTFSP